MLIANPFSSFAQEDAAVVQAAVQESGVSFAALLKEPSSFAQFIETQKLTELFPHANGA